MAMPKTHDLPTWDPVTPAMDTLRCFGLTETEEIPLRIDSAGHIRGAISGEFDSYTIKGAGNFNGARSWYETFPDVIRARIRDTIFESFILALPTTQGRTDYQPLHALIERWSESTHTFQLSFGAYMLDPVSFAAVTDIACTGDPVPLNVSLFRSLVIGRTTYGCFLVWFPI